jgi:mRNA-degrading endonuclease toxin of MazEF toxin-antitoxin module
MRTTLSTMIGENTMAWSRGDVVLIPFPFSDLQAIKTHPAIIVSSQALHTIRQELLLVYVTSQLLTYIPSLITRSPTGKQPAC